MSDLFSSGICFSISLIIFVLGIMKWKTQRKIKRNGTAAKGYIYDMKETYPVVRFITKNDEWITEQHSTNGVYKKGETLTVYYNPANPEEFFIDDLRTRLTPYALVAGGVLGAVFGILAKAHLVPWHT